MTAVILAIGLIFFFGCALYDHVFPLLRRIAEALEDIAETLDIAFCDSDESLSDSTRIVTALEKLAHIPPPVPTEPKKEEVE